MKHLFRTSALAALLLALTGLAFTPFEGASPEASKATHTLTIEYQQERGDFRRASLKIAPKEDGARAPWRGRLHSISVLTTDKRWIIIQSMEQSRGGNVQARAMLPGPGDISAIVLKPMRGPIVGWKVEEGEAYMEVEWTYFNQRGQQTDSPESDEPKEDPPSDGDDGDDGGDDGDDGDGDDDEGCSTAGCSGIIDPWTCECEDDIRDPWEDEVTNNVVVLSI